MATKSHGETNGCTFQWKIENVSHCWWLKKGERIQSPVFIAESTKWLLCLYLMGVEDENQVVLSIHRHKYCIGPDVKVKFEFLGADGSLVMEKPLYSFGKEVLYGYVYCDKRKRIFDRERETFLPEDTLTIQCKIWSEGTVLKMSKHLLATTVIKIKRRSFVWRIEKISTLKSDLIYEFKDYLISSDLVLNKGLDRLDMNMISVHNSIRYISCKTSIIDSEGKNGICEIKKYFEEDLKKGVSSILLFPTKVMENKSQYLPNDALTLEIEFVFSINEHFGYTRNFILQKEVISVEKSQKTAILADDLNSIYNDAIFSDMEIRTSTKTFPVHKNILSARSSVFRNMFSHDMVEKNSGHIDITDFEDDTIHRMLLYMYTDSLEDLQIEGASKLYTIADKYQILSLKSRCSSFLIEYLCPKNAFRVLDMAVLHNDDDLKNSVQDYILGKGKQIFHSQEWKDFMNNHLKLAADIMYKKIAKNLQ